MPSRWFNFFWMNLKNTFKLPYYFIKNLHYNRQTWQVMQQVLKPGSNSIDIGCHKGKILDKILQLSPEGHHWAFEPLPELYEGLVKKYAGKQVTFSPIALSNCDGEVPFKQVTNSPGYSGFRKREYHIPFPVIKEIQVTTARLDQLIPAGVHIDFIKLDVEGAELEVLQGAAALIKNCRPFIIFEHGMGAAPYYDTKPTDVYSLLNGYGLQINTMKGWLEKKAALSPEAFIQQFRKELNYYFVAY